jgi:hypothetical protein
MEREMPLRPRERLFRMNTLTASLDCPLIISRIPNAVKEISARLSVSDKCAEHWLTGRAKPNGDNVVALLAQFDEVCDEVLRIANRNQGGLTQAQRTALLKVIGEK